MLTSDSGRIYRSGNPFKRPCPLISIAQTREELDALHEKYKTHGSTVPEKPKPPAGKSKPTAVDQRNYQKLCKGIEEERNLAEKLDELVPLVEKEEQVGYLRPMLCEGEGELTVAYPKGEEENSSGVASCPVGGI